MIPCKYNPVPTRAWSRTQGICTYLDPSSNYTSAFLPMTGQTITQAQANYEMQQLYKGNILQYKNNSNQFTKNQKYARIANNIVKQKIVNINRCNNVISRSATICSPMSASDVPGNGFLCWNNQFQTFFPRNKYTNNNSGTKWPQGYKGFVSAAHFT